MMKIMLNGTPLELDKGVTITELLKHHGYADKVVAIAVNGSFVPKSAHNTQMINENDAIEIVAPMQGG